MSSVVVVFIRKHLTNLVVEHIVQKYAGDDEVRCFAWPYMYRSAPEGVVAKCRIFSRENESFLYASNIVCHTEKLRPQNRV